MIGYRIKEALRGFAVLAFLGAVIFLALRCQGCRDPEVPKALSAENALAVKQYDEKIVECQQTARQKPKPERFEAFVDCERSVSKFFCEASEDLRREWPRCQEVDR